MGVLPLQTQYNGDAKRQRPRRVVWVRNESRVHQSRPQSLPVPRSALDAVEGAHRQLVRPIADGPLGNRPTGLLGLRYWCPAVGLVYPGRERQALARQTMGPTSPGQHPVVLLWMRPGPLASELARAAMADSDEIRLVPNIPEKAVPGN